MLISPFSIFLLGKIIFFFLKLIKDQIPKVKPKFLKSITLLIYFSFILIMMFGLPNPKGFGSVIERYITGKAI